MCGAHELDIDIAGGSFTVNGVTVRQGDVISINGTTGEVVIGAVPLFTPESRPARSRRSSGGPTSCAR